MVGPFENKSFIRLHEFRISESEFGQLSEVTRSILGVSCYAATELNVLSKIYIHCGPDPNEEVALNSLNLTQRFVVLRIWSAKLYEYWEFVKTMKPDGEDADEIFKIQSRALRCFDKLKKQSGFPLFQSLRNEATNHFSIKSARKNIAHLGNGADLSLQLHEMDGNSFYPLGEEVMFSGRLNRFTSNRISREDRLRAGVEWMDFNYSATRWARRVHAGIVRRLLFKHFPDKRVRAKEHWLPTEYVGDIDQSNIPVFLRKPHA